MQGHPITESAPAEHGGPLPEAADLVVVGGGVVGVATALFAARRGLKTVLLEKGRIAGEQSSRNWGWIRQQGRDPAELPIMVEAGRLWRRLARETNEDIGLRQTGVTYLARSEEEMARYAGWLPHAQANGVDSHLMSANEVAALLPGAATRWAGAMRTPSDMRAEPWVAVPALARIAAREGAVIREGCAARLLDVQAGRVTGVVTEAGRVRCASVVVAGGAWSSLLLRRHGVAIPQLSVRATAAATAPLPEVHPGAAVDDRFAFRRRADGGYTLAAGGFHELFVGPDALRTLPAWLRQIARDPFGARYLPAAPRDYPDGWGTARRWGDEQTPFERRRILDPAPNRKKAREVARLFGQTFPGLGEVRLRAVWAGMIDVMPDTVPVVDRAGPDGLFVCTGMSGHGFGIGPAMGRIMADWAAGAAPGHDLHRFRFSRFRDGSRLEPGPTF